MKTSEKSYFWKLVWTTSTFPIVQFIEKTFYLWIFRNNYTHGISFFAYQLGKVMFHYDFVQNFITTRST